MSAVLLVGTRAHAAPPELERDLQPLPPKIFFEDPELFELETLEEISAEIEESFADLNKVTLARARLIRRFGPVTVHRLREEIRGTNRTRVWNALLTIAGLRDTYGPSPAVQRALPDVFRVLVGGGEEHAKAFAALTLGNFPFTEGEGAGANPRLQPVPGPTVLRNAVAKALRDSREYLGSFAASPSNSGVLARACLLALAKMGGPAAAKQVCGIDPLVKRGDSYRQALLLARAFAHAEAGPCLDAIANKHKDEPRFVTTAAALAVAVSLLVEDRPEWTKERDDLHRRLLFLKNKGASHNDERAASLFARGINALVNEAPDPLWRAIWEETTHVSVKDVVAQAGAQAMLFCPRRWFHDDIVQWALSPSSPPRDSVRSMVLLRAGELASPKAVEACIRWIRSKSERPVPAADWDPRWYAIVGLLRSLHHQRLTDPVLREQVVGALQRAERVVLKPSPFKDALDRLLKQHGKVLHGSSSLPLAALADVEGSMPDPWGLLGADARDLCAHRVNQLVEEIFNFGAIVPSTVGEPQKTLQGERYLRRYLDDYPYFSRLQFQTRRGAREPLTIDGSRPEGLNK